MRFSASIAILLGSIFCQGCVVFPYPTPEVRGSVVDATTKQAISGVRIAVRNHSNIHCTSAADGSFTLPAGSRWGFCFLMPGDYLALADVCFKAEDYRSVINRYCGGMGSGRPVILEQPVELQKQTQP
ncbi:MAG: carboxypeptidase-like regulatory domain-containing protein [Verrucomicrobiae bacterium]|nr:carboxypeptidase-like regulatory domain-containing protein [Verrucomicrobiae bacterium]